MALNLAPIIPAIFTGPNGEALSPEQIRDRQLIAQSLMGQATDTSPNAGGWASILAKGVQGFQAGRERRGADSAIAGNNTYNSDLLSSLLSGSATSATSSPMAASASTSGVAQEMAQTSPAPTVDISGDKETFVASLLPAAIEESKRTGVDPRIIVAQAAQETGWGRSAPGNNYFGIKSHGQGGGQNLATHEYVDGKRVNVNDSFRTFESPADSVRGYGDFILKNPRYEGLRTAQGLDGQLQALQASGYATDPNYSRSVGAIARGIRLPETPAAAIEAVAPASGFRGSDYNSPMLTYDDRGARVERPYTDPAVSVQPQAATQSGFDGDRFGNAPAGPSMAGAAPEIYSAQTDFAPELPAPVNVAPAPAVAAVQQPAAQPAQLPQAPSANTAIIAQALRVMGDPRANDGTRRVAQALLQQEQQKQQFSQEQSVWQQRQDYERQQQNSDPLRQAQIAKLQREAATGGETFFGNPIPIQNPDGTVAYGQIGNQGTFRPIQLGQGQTFAPPTKTIDTGTETLMLDQAGNVVSRTPKQNREAAAQTSMGSAEGKSAAETASEYSSITSKMPGLYSVVDRLSNLADKATYTLAGQALDFGRSQVGMDPREAAVARAEYTATIDNQILPLLKDTFGAQFTDAEGLRLAATLGDANKTPTEKQALLKAFIQQKERDIEALRARTGRTEPQQSSAPAKPASRLKFNPQTGELE